MSLINLKPCDNTFFGDGNQFKFDISKVLKSKNMPYTSVFFGAIFTAILSCNDEFREKFFKLGEYDHENILNINQVYLYNKKTNKVYIKSPLDLFTKLNYEKTLKAFGKFKKVDINLKSLSYDMIMYSPLNKDYVRAVDKYININNIFDAYLKRQSLRVELKDEKEIFVKGFKVGIGMDKATKNVFEGRLYKIEQTEFINNDWSYIVDYTICQKYLKNNIDYKEVNLKDLKCGYLKLGGENKVCKYKKIQNLNIDKFVDLKNREIESDKFKILLTSDSYFEGDISEVFSAIGFEVVGISNDKPIYIGGFDMERREGKCRGVRKMYKGYSAGTVILVKALNGSVSSKIIRNIKEMNNPKGFNKYVVMRGDF